MSTRGDPKDARKQTDEKLRAERDRTNEEIVDRSRALAEDSDELVRQARERARAVLDLARGREDRSLQRAGADSDATTAVAGERSVADDALTVEHAEEDASALDERERHRRAVLQLLAWERDETDWTLATERSVADRMVDVRDEMLGVVSHDLRSHLSLLLLKAAVIIETHPEDQRLVRDADAIQRTVARMDKLLSDLLDVATMEGDSVRVEPATTDLVTVVADEVAAHVPAASTRSLQLVLKKPESPILVEIDPARISRVLMNLLSNAIKFTPAGGLITVRVGCDEGTPNISVEDSGPGIATDQLDSVFERFRQVDPHRRGTGYGLGLYIARAIVTAHGGRIWAESTPGEGSTFHIQLPACQAANER